MLLAVPVFWALQLCFILMAIVALRFKTAQDPERRWRAASLLWLLAGPVLIALLGIWQTDALVNHFSGFHWQDALLLTLLIAELVCAVWLVRRLDKRWLAVLAGIGALWYTAATVLVATWAMNHAWP